jgi:hypothetical protein
MYDNASQAIGHRHSAYRDFASVASPPWRQRPRSFPLPRRSMGRRAHAYVHGAGFPPGSPVQMPSDPRRRRKGSVRCTPLMRPPTPRQRIPVMPNTRSIRLHFLSGNYGDPLSIYFAGSPDMDGGGHIRRSPPRRMETQRQWSDSAIARTPALLGLPDRSVGP